MAEAEAVVDRNGPEFRRMAVDVALQASLGRFFAAKFRSGVLYGIYERSGERAALQEAIDKYRLARAVWAGLAERARPIYLPDITVGEEPHLRGHWLDRLQAMDEDIADMTRQLELARGNETQQDRIRSAIVEALNRPRRTRPPCRHLAPRHFAPGQPLEIQLSLERPGITARLFYRHVNQAERFDTAQMQLRDNLCRSVIPGTYTDSPYALQYYFELKEGPERAWLYPGFSLELSNQPYFVVPQQMAH